MTTTPALPRNRWLWLAAVGLMLLELVVFDRLGASRQAAVYPRWSDQIQYLTESYDTYLAIKQDGWWKGLHFACVNPAAQGTLHDLVAGVVFQVFGASRRVALDLNLVALLLWQAATLFAVPRISGSRALGWIGFGLIPCLAGSWTADAGSAVDFRLDHAAMSLWGVTATVALLTRGFRDLRWSLVFGAVAGVTLVERFLTGAYFAPVFLAAGIWILCGDEKLRRLRNLVLAGLVTFALAAPFFWVNRIWIYNYYYMGHFGNAESAARAPGFGLWRSIMFIADNFGSRHMGWAFGLFALVLTLVPFLLESFWDRLRATKLAPDRAWLFIALVFFLVPSGILCLHRQKSEYVLGIIAPGLILSLLWLWNLTLPGLAGLTRHSRLLSMAAATSVVLGLGFFVYRQVAPPYSRAFLADANRVAAFVDRLYVAAQQPGQPATNIAVDQIMDSLDGPVLRVVAFERHGAWIAINSQLPITILPQEESLIFDRLAKSDFVFLTDEQVGNGYWPYDHQMRALYPRLKEWCDAHLDKVEVIPIFQKQMSLYQRRRMP